MESTLWCQVLLLLCTVWKAGAGASSGGDQQRSAYSCWNGLQPATGYGSGYALSCLHYEAVKPGLTDCIYSTLEGVVAEALNEDPTNAGPLLRLHFHDCFINGCDGSILLNTTTKTSSTELDAIPNLTLDGFDIIDRAKAAVDATCSPDVTCADILAIVAALIVEKTGGPKYTVPLGRLDGCETQMEAALARLPSPQATVRGVYNGAGNSLMDAFEVQGLNAVDLVTLSGAHTIGQAHCFNFKDRICYGGQSTPVALDKRLYHKLVDCCVHNKPGACAGNISSSVPTDTPQMDLERGTPNQTKTYPPTGGGLLFDNSYFKNIRAKMGLLTSDQALYSDPVTSGLVDQYADNQQAFFDAFVKSIVRMGNIIPANAGVTPGAGMQLCRSTQPCEDGSLPAFGVRESPRADSVCPSQPVAGVAQPKPSCLAYKQNKYGIRTGKCSVPGKYCTSPER